MNKNSADLENMPIRSYGQTMELAVLKALGDETRHALYREISASTAPRSAADLAESLALHPNTVRLHLERLRDAGLIEVEVAHRGTVGRPQHRYSLAPGAPGLGFDPPAHVLLSGLLAALAETSGAKGAGARATGRAWGRAAAERSLERTPDQSCLSLVAAELDRLGFEPAADDTGTGDRGTDDRGTGDSGPQDASTRIEFLHCPFRELAEAYPDLVCNLHRGIVEGVAESRRGTVEAFSTLYEPDPCHVVVALP